LAATGAVCSLGGFAHNCHRAVCLSSSKHGPVPPPQPIRNGRCGPGPGELAQALAAQRAHVHGLLAAVTPDAAAAAAAAAPRITLATLAGAPAPRQRYAHVR